MRRSRRFFVLALIAWAFVAVASGIALAPPAPEKDQRNPNEIRQQGDEKQTRRSNNSPSPKVTLRQSNQKEANNNQGNPDKSWGKNQGSADKSFWDNLWENARRPEWIIAGVTALYAVFAGLQWWTIKRQVSLTASLEQPRLFLSGVGFQPNGQMTDKEISVVFKNKGRSPAYIIGGSVNVHFGPRLPRKPTYRPVAPSPAGAQVIFPDDIFAMNQEVSLAPQTIGLVQTGATKMWAYGFLAFRDFLHAEHKARFGQRWYQAPDDPKLRWYPEGSSGFVWSLDIPDKYNKHT